MFLDPHKDNPAAMDARCDAAGGEGRFIFARVAAELRLRCRLAVRASQMPGAFRWIRCRSADPPVAVLLPYGKSMSQHAALANVSRSQDGVLRDVPLRDVAGEWGLPTLPTRLAAQVQGKPASTYPPHIRVNWRKHSRVPYISAADLLAGETVCHAPGVKPPALPYRRAGGSPPRQRSRTDADQRCDDRGGGLVEAPMPVALHRD